jgi:hypothetical protein
MILGCICFAALTQPVWGQTGAQSPRSVPRHLTAGTTMPKPTAVEDNLDFAQAALTTFGGTFTFKFTITIKSTNLGADTITCMPIFVVEDFNATTGVVSGSIVEEESVLASVSGSTATCTVNIPYSWGLANGSTDMVGISYDIEALNLTLGSKSQPVRVQSRSFPNIHVPANGATTTINVAATI